MRIQCLRTEIKQDGTERFTYEEIHIAEVRYHESLKSYWLYISPGVTGYESAEVALLLKHKGDWCACAGTPGSWDKLVIPADVIECLKDVLRLVGFKRE